ncbi:MAG: FHA domain-containing protein [Deltaproteobacteria bacterium]|nr:FHA domain-containing protein [Deltaproteobacteria bacterium]
MGSRPLLILTSKKNPTPLVYELDQKEIGIGRDAANFVVLESRAASRCHAKILVEKEDLFLLDLKSANGTFLNNRQMNHGEKTILRPGDKIRIEEFEMQFVTGDKQKIADPSGESPLGGSPYEVTESDVLEVKMIKKILKAIDKETAPSLEVLKGKYAGKKLVLEGKTQTVVIGRDPACEWMLDEEVISRRHAKVTKKWDTVTLEDLDSKNGTFVNNTKVKTKQLGRIALRDGDSLLLGTIPVRYHNPQDINAQVLAPIITEEEVKSAPKPKPAPPEPRLKPAQPAVQEPEEGQFSELPVEKPAGLLGPAEIFWIVIGGVALVLCVAAVIALLK